MSSNNQLIILKEKGKYSVHLHFCVDNPFRASKDNLIKKFKTLVEAIKFANDYCIEEMVEYGTHICDSCLVEEKNEKRIKKTAKRSK